MQAKSHSPQFRDLRLLGQAPRTIATFPRWRLGSALQCETAADGSPKVDAWASKQDDSLTVQKPSAGWPRSPESEEMTDKSARPALNLAIAAIVATVLGGCTSGSQQAALQEPGVAPETPATVRADQIVGRWGVASYQDPKDRTRVEAAAKAQCKLPYVITAGASGGVVMHLADEAAPQDLRLKGSPSGKNYIGPPGPAGGEKDREVVSVDSRLLITRFVDPDAAKRYGYMVYVRCT